MARIHMQIAFVVYSVIEALISTALHFLFFLNLIICLRYLSRLLFNFPHCELV